MALFIVRQDPAPLADGSQPRSGTDASPECTHLNTPGPAPCSRRRAIPDPAVPNTRRRARATPPAGPVLPFRRCRRLALGVHDCRSGTKCKRHRRRRADARVGRLPPRAPSTRFQCARASPRDEVRGGQADAPLADGEGVSELSLRRSGGLPTKSQRPVLLVRSLVRNWANLSALERQRYRGWIAEGYRTARSGVNRCSRGPPARAGLGHTVVDIPDLCFPAVR